MRKPDFDLDGWCLEDGEVRHQEAPNSFWIPPLSERESLKPGDLVKLIFKIHVGNSIAVERMWVIVRDLIPSGYLGVLDNNPDSIQKNDELWSGIELPFSASHVIDFEEGDKETIEIASKAPTRRWSAR